ncbi:MAG: putative lipid II flippase FtsW [Bacillota bacterium]
MAKHKKKKKPVDFIIFISVITLVFIGIIMVYSASWPEGMVRYEDGSHYAKRHIQWALVGIIAMIVTMNIEYRIWKRLSVPIYITAIILGFMIFSPLGVEIKGARRWIDLGFTTFMPSDAIKLGSIVFFAAFLDNKKERIRKIFDGALPAFIFIGISAALVYLQRDLSTTVTVAGTMFAMYFVAGMWLPILGVIIAGVGIFARYAIFSEGNEYRQRRLLAFMDPFADKLGDGWQIVQSLYAMGSGGLLGVGLGQSRQKFFYIPESYNDFIFSIIGEELGLVGTLFVLLLYAMIIWRGFIIAFNAKDAFGCYLATGITSLLAIQTFINIGVVTSSIPVTGITLPLISFGGTSLVIYLAGLGILMNISRTSNTDRRRTDENNN